MRDAERIGVVAAHIRERAELGDELIIVVSARAGVTNSLLRRAQEISSKPPAAAVDALLCIGEYETAALLAIALNGMGVPAVSRNAYQIGIVTCSTFGNARIRNIFGGDVEECLGAGQVVIVAGFQGIDENLCPTTLGRGGSDLTAIALAHRFKADLCEIYTDVDGAFSGDPRVIDKPIAVKTISHGDLFKQALYDNELMQDRSMAFAEKMGINFSIASLFGKNPGDRTQVMEGSPCGEDCAIALTHRMDLVLISMLSEKNIFDDFLKIFAQNRVSANFMKHTKLHTSGKFLAEVAVSLLEYSQLNTSNFSALLPAEVSVINGLTRINVVGVRLEYSPWLGDLLSLMGEQEIFRAEYGKGDLSFLLKAADPKALLNAAHRIIFE
jgi:aspartate kinase